MNGWRTGLFDRRANRSEGDMARKTIDCRELPSEKGCTLTISGEEEEVLRAGMMHAVDAHGHRDTPEFREQLRGALHDEGAPMKGQPSAGREEHAQH